MSQVAGVKGLSKKHLSSVPLEISCDAPLREWQEALRRWWRGHQRAPKRGIPEQSCCHKRPHEGSRVPPAMRAAKPAQLPSLGLEPRTLQLGKSPKHPCLILLENLSWFFFLFSFLTENTVQTDPNQAIS